MSVEKVSWKHHCMWSNMIKQTLVFFIMMIKNIYIAQIPCEYDQMRVTNKYDTI